MEIANELTENEAAQRDDILNEVNKLLTRRILLQREISMNQSKLEEAQNIQSICTIASTNLQKELKSCEFGLLAVIGQNPASENEEELKNKQRKPKRPHRSPSHSPAPHESIFPNVRNDRIGKDFQVDVPEYNEFYNQFGQCLTDAECGEDRGDCLISIEELEKGLCTRTSKPFSSEKHRRSCKTPGCRFLDCHTGPHSTETLGGLRLPRTQPRLSSTTSSNSSREDVVCKKIQKVSHRQTFGNELIGKRLNIYWIAEKRSFFGTVTRYHNNKHYILYEDGDYRFHNLNSPNEKWDFVSP